MSEERKAKELAQKLNDVKPVKVRQTELPDTDTAQSTRSSLINEPPPVKTLNDLAALLASDSDSVLLKPKAARQGINASALSEGKGVVAMTGRGGRPSLANYIKAQTGESGESLADIMLAIAAGKMAVYRNVITKEGEIINCEFTPTIQEIMQSVMWLTDRAHGKAKDIIQIEQTKVLSDDLDYSVLSVDELRLMKELHEKAKRGQRAIESSTTVVPE